jgi:hypothetical protein
MVCVSRERERERVCVCVAGVCVCVCVSACVGKREGLLRPDDGHTGERMHLKGSDCWRHCPNRGGCVRCGVRVREKGVYAYLSDNEGGMGS